MRRFLVASHGTLSHAILQSAALIIGEEKINNFVHIGVELNDSHDKVKSSIDAYLNSWGDEDQILVLTDIMGGNITNILSEYIGVRDLHIITGMNLGMVLEVILSDEKTPIEELAESIVNMGKTGIEYLNITLQKEGGAEI
ncbi:hypothetical protein K0H71_21635 [Bacillus sp. IITD106]|nr:hypothetical protein [Bacillus sp. IITD106]